MSDDMKNKIITAVVYLTVAILLISGPQKFFAVCKSGQTPMKCFWSIRAEIGIAGMLIVSAVIYLLTNTVREKILVSGNAIAIGIVAILIPKFLIGGCSMESMACQSLTFPAIYVISALMILYSLLDIVYLKNKEKNAARIARIQTQE